MNALAAVYTFKIVATVVAWSIPLVFFPGSWLEAMLGSQDLPNLMLIRMLGWAYLSLCVGYGFGRRAALSGQILEGPIWMGVVSNGGACSFLIYYGATGSWEGLHLGVKFILWSSAIATVAITIGLYLFGVRVLHRQKAETPTSVIGYRRSDS